MRLFHWMAAGVLLGGSSLGAEVPELLELVPEARGYELIAKLNPLKWQAEGYTVDNSEGISGEIRRVGYLLKLTGNDGKKSWVFTAMDPFTKTVGQLTVPAAGSEIFQLYVDHLEVAGNVEGVKTGKFEKGNIEFWGKNYSGKNAKNIPGATDQFDFGDAVSGDGAYGSMQVHNYLEKQTVFSFSNLNANRNCDLGIGNSPSGQPDWTFTKSGSLYSDAELYIVGKFDNFQLKEAVLLDPQKSDIVVTLDRNPVEYAVGDTMTFTVKPEIGGQKPDRDYFISWVRTGDDGKTEQGKSKISDGPFTVKTSLDRPGFVRFRAMLTDRNGRTLKRKVNIWGREQQRNIMFDGGAGADIAKITQAAPEPADFDAFWQKQKARLAEVPLKYQMDKVGSKDGVDIFAVTIDCAGPRPVTGYLTMPANAAEKSLPARAQYHGYGVGRQGPPGSGSKNEIVFSVNAHGYELNKDEKYYQDFAESIKSNGKGYAFDPVQNADPEEAYFNGMALRVMRSLEFLKSLPQWNGKDLTAAGGSQGGLQTVWAASLDPDVTRASADVPWCCNLAGKAKGQRLFGDWHIEWLEPLGYYDAVNHARRVKCRMEIPRAGLGDYTCPPSGIAVLYNNLPAPKKITWVQNSDHGYVAPDSQKFVVEEK